MMLALLSMVSLLLLLGTALGLEANWVGNDENAPLPQSAKYRDNLRKLCAILDKGGRLPTSYSGDRRKVLISMCSKLKRDDENVSGAVTISTIKNTVLALGCGGLALFAIREHGPTLLRWVRARFGSKRSTSSSTDKVKRTRGGAKDDLVNAILTDASLEQLSALREARLKRFAATDLASQPHTSASTPMLED